MIVCSCHAVSDRSLRAAAASGLSHREIVAATGAGSDCGHCSSAVAAIVVESGGPCRGDHACPDCPKRRTA
jgi:bacterioferritin-associated ferredoxin